jgi:hypothetical protein
MSEERQRIDDLARQVVVSFGAGLAGYMGPGAGAVAAGAAPLVLAGLDYVSATIWSRRLDHAAEALTDGAEAFGAETPEEFIAFVEAAVSDEEHQELLARALTIAQDTAMRDKRRALGRALANAASDTGTKVDEELLQIRVLADLDEPHIRVLRLLATTPQHAIEGLDIPTWTQWGIGKDDPGLKVTALVVLDVLERHGLVSTGTMVRTPRGRMEPIYTITPYGKWFLTSLAEPEQPRPEIVASAI